MTAQKLAGEFHKLLKDSEPCFTFRELDAFTKTVIDDPESFQADGADEYALPDQLPTSSMPDLKVAFPNLSSPKVPAVVREHESEIVRLANDALVRTVMGNEEGAVLVAGLTEIESLGRPAKYIESTCIRHTWRTSC